MSEGAPPPIRVGIGGWTFPPWRGPFYPEGLPHAQGTQPCQPAGHAGFRDDRLAPLLREHGVALVLVDDEAYPMLTDRTAGFAYARLRRCSETEPAGCGAAALDEWVGRFECLATETGPCLAHFINGAKIRAPAAAMAPIERLSA
jgi:uncharacterized protein YecE (DUF72 family)